MQRTISIAGGEIPRIGLGTNRLTEAPEHLEFLREAVAAGIRMIDTAHRYTGGASESAIGQALPDGAGGVLVATKGGFGDARPEVLRAQIEESLRRLRCRTIDLYYLHRVDPKVPLETSLGAIQEFVEDGRIGQVGLSAVTVDEIERARALVPVGAVQNEYSLAERGGDEVIDHCEREGIAFLPYFPLRGESPAVTDIARRRGLTGTQVKLAWLLSRSPAMLPIPGTLTVEHARQNLAALDVELSADEIAQLAVI